jgi:cytochrome c peroxidase
MRTSPLLLALSFVACKRHVPRESPKPIAPVVSASVVTSALPAPPPLVRDDVETHFKAFDKVAAEDAKSKLGRALYFDERLSKNHDLSCNSCHDLSRYGVDGAQFSSGHKGQLGARNSPTVYNARDHVAQFWDGRAKDLVEQAKGPILNPVEMASSEARVVATLRSMPEYVAMFRDAFGSGITFRRVAEAIASFEKRLVTPGRFDKYLRGDETALDQNEKAGLARFIKLGCVTCHNGEAVGGGSFQKLGLQNAWPGLKDEGRFVVTKNPEDKFKFRVPSLRNIAKTAPYFHDGAETRLDEVVRKMAFHQLGVTLRDDEVSSLVAFLNALTGELPIDSIKQPELPKSTATTPKPDPT